jgi:hypothetical protein
LGFYLAWEPLSISLVSADLKRDIYLINIIKVVVCEYSAFGCRHIIYTDNKPKMVQYDGLLIWSSLFFAN